MPAPLVECIPNFSEARRPEVVEEILSAIRAVDGIRVLDHHSDLDHNRTVVTYVGAPAAVEEAAFQGIRTAAGRINLDEHTGAHPRIGATDVVPFVPIAGVTMHECVEMARRLGKRVGEELQIPVYLYEEAAARPERQNLENIRKGQYEGLKEEIASQPSRAPDFGPARLGTAGATVIGARQPLIAFNAYLTTDEVPIAQKIARAIRQSSGGLRYVKAMGILVDGRAQVSMNLTDFRQTPIARVVELVRREATRFGVAIHHTELVGLAPQESLVDAAVWYLQLDQFEHDQVLETKLFEVQHETGETTPSLTQPSFIERLAAGTPTPGGGSASAYTGAEAAALVAMVARLTVGKKKYAEVEPQMWTVIGQADALRTELSNCVEEDSAAFEELMAAMKLPKDDEVQLKIRAEAIENATIGAIRVPLKVARLSQEAMKLALLVCQQGNTNAISDSATGAALARAALTGAGYNIRINCQGLQNQGLSDQYFSDLQELEKQADEIQKAVAQTLIERGGFNIG
jgi:glutamate formiminotransferase/formiminotetrahydrofolate cyclodeaminase